ncbi:MAG TPA: amidohydrolase family protein [Devosia sp.]|jgi:predicted TIM-barrel fold metal-dependent hydrolase|nr:amidohydrolase family protein [Devosia sp.]
MRVIDTHLHLIYRDRFKYEWLEKEPELNRQWDAPSYWAEAEALGIEAAIHMEVDVPIRQSDDENAFVLSVDPRVVGAVSNARPENIDFPAHLERLLAEPRIRGIRRLLQNDPDDLSRGELFRENVRRLAPHGLTFDLCIRSWQLPAATELVSACPEVTFVLDHCGNPPIASGDLAAWRRDLAALAERPNVVGKVSGIVIHAKKGWTADDLRPAIEHTIECFGWDRVMFGSDRPVLTLNGTLSQWVAALKIVVAGSSANEKAALFHRNAERVYGV